MTEQDYADASNSIQDQLRRFLIVGCGGSGAATMAYMMDQLRSDLAAHGVPELPSGWQFVEIDVPITPEPGPANLKHVQAQGGTYLGIGVAAGKYSDLDAVVSQRLAKGRQLGAIATWAPREPGQVKTPISLGAGQFRVVGRMLTARKLPEVRDVLAKAWARLQRPEAHSSMAALGRFGSYQDGADPVVLVISSMAGGAGASMQLDVCRLLSTLPGMPTGQIGAFMVGPDVFDGLPVDQRRGVRANALAMLGEIVAAQLGSASETDHEVLRAAGLDFAPVSPPFARVFPVNSVLGINRTPFGAGDADAVFRGVARGLAALMLSASATRGFVQYDLANTQGLDHDRDLLGWGGDRDGLPWGSFGYSSLTMGRERYAEYAAQRLARGAIDHLLVGHLADAPPGTPGDEAAARLGETLWPHVLRGVQLHDPASGLSFGQWMTTVLWPLREVEQVTAPIVQGITASLTAPDGQQPAAWQQHVTKQLATATLRSQAEVTDRARAWAWEYHRRLVADVERVVTEAVRSHGLAYGLEVCARLAAAIEAMVGSGLTAAQRPLGQLGLPESVRSELAPMRGAISNGGSILAKVRAGVTEWATGRLYRDAAAIVTEVWRDLLTDVLAPLRTALEASTHSLTEARRIPSTRSGIAFLQTLSYQDWPAAADPLVPRRFDHATNEVLLTTSASYRQHFETHVRQDSGDERDAVAAIVSGRWSTGDQTTPPGGLVSGSTWVPKAFPTAPDGSYLTPRAAKYTFHVTPGDVLRRARAFVGRPHKPFAQFCDVSLRSYVQGVDDEFAQRERRREVVGKFREALTLGLPLAAPDRDVVEKLYGAPVQYRYKFSAIPFGGDPVAAELRAVLVADNEVDHDTALGEFEKALSTSDDVKRIDVFGSYPNYAPVCFHSLVEPIRSEWASLDAKGREEFWKLRRARPLPGSLPLHDHERRALVAGWFVGLIVGKLSRPDWQRRGDPETVRVLDGQTGRWVPFPEPPLTPFHRVRNPADWLPSVLESILVATVGVNQGEKFSSLRPFRLLRGLFDTAPGEPTRIGVRAVQDELAHWLAAGRGPADSAVAVDTVDAAATIEQRAAAVEEYLARQQQMFAQFLSPERPGELRPLANRQVAADIPLVRDLVPDIMWALAEIRGELGAATVQAAELVFTAEAAPVAGEVSTLDEIPDLTGF